MDVGTSKQPRGALLVANLPSLQFLIKRDPKSYIEEFTTQWNAYNAARALLESAAASRQAEERWKELVTFIAQVAPCYPVEAKDFPSHLSGLLLNANATNLSPDTRKTLVQSLVLLKNKGMLSRVELLKVLFPLLGMTSSPNLRSFILKSILQDIKQANKKSKNHKLNRIVQTLLFNMVRRGTAANSGLEGTGTRGNKTSDKAKNAAVSGREAMLAVKLASELWRKQIWTDDKTVQIVAEACFHANTKVTSAAIHFFLRTPGDDLPEDSDEEADDKGPDIKRMYHQSTINKTRRSTKRKEVQTVKTANKKRKRDAAERAASTNISAIQLLLDPQTFAERLYDSLAKNDRAFTLEHKVLVMQLFGRVTGVHSLTVLGFYSYATKYLTHHQAQVTSILVAVAQSVHSLTPPDVLLPVVRKLAHEFVHPGVNAEVIAAGINSVREVCRRQPMAMEKDLLEDLIDYRKSKDKGVMNAARSLLQLYREACPTMLRKKERGKLATMNATDKEELQYGKDANNVSGIAGIELLQAHLAEKATMGDVEEPDQDAQWQGWEADSDQDSSDESENGWINVSSGDEGEIAIDVSDEEETHRDKRRQTETQEEAEESDDDAISIQLADSEDESSDDGNPEAAAEDETAVPGEAEIDTNAFKNIAAEQILTPADFARIDQLKLEAAEKEVAEGGGSAARRKVQALAAAKKAAQSGEFLSESEIIGYRKHVKDSYEERMASIQSGREGREKYGSKKGQHKAEKGSSTTNYEKRKTKNFMMTLHSSKVKSKRHASLRDQQKKLRGHITKQKNKKKK